ncbi:hypothetical protein M514_10337 [Trichuris suis]|uniref:Uncharacterized protein n=1 Tax=Trichuris suis TaxID=68888 RepID=A0A085NIN7_9BILA|nr:hypothetical protein M514_10337 [Trichuris suis]
MNRWTRTMAPVVAASGKDANSVIMKYEAKMDAQAVLPFGEDLQSANNGVLTCQCERRFTVGIPSSHQ